MCFSSLISTLPFFFFLSDVCNSNVLTSAVKNVKSPSRPALSEGVV